jgi:acetyltransferase-like isoleucine patch superfamily enzyme
MKKIGAYEHIYNNSFIDESIPTHYIVFPISYILDDDEYNLIITNNNFLDQHLNYLWCDKNTIHENNNIHHYVKYYLLNNSPNKFI